MKLKNYIRYKLSSVLTTSKRHELTPLPSRTVLVYTTPARRPVSLPRTCGSNKCNEKLCIFYLLGISILLESCKNKILKHHIYQHDRQKYLLIPWTLSGTRHEQYHFFTPIPIPNISKEALTITNTNTNTNFWRRP